MKKYSKKYSDLLSKSIIYALKYNYFCDKYYFTESKILKIAFRAIAEFYLKLDCLTMKRANKYI